LIPYKENVDLDFAYFTWYPGTIGFFIFLCLRMTDKFNFFLLPLSFVVLYFIHYFAGIFVVGMGFYSNPHPEWGWYYLIFLYIYVIPFFILSFIIAIIVELVKWVDA